MIAYPLLRGEHLERNGASFLGGTKDHAAEKGGRPRSLDREGAKLQKNEQRKTCREDSGDRAERGINWTEKRYDC